MDLSEFIEQRMETLLEEWESFARDAQPHPAALDREELRNWARTLLEAMASEMRSSQTDTEQESKSKVARPDYAPSLTDAAQTHAMDRLAQGFNIDQMVSEYRALRASVVRRWTAERTANGEALQQLNSFASTKRWTRP